MTDLSGIQQAMQKLVEKTTEQQASTAGKPPAGDLEKLEAALHPPTEQAQGVEPVPGVTPSGTESPGAKILDGLNGVRTGFNEAMQDMQKAAQASDSPSELLKVQIKLQQVTLEQELLGKVTSKAEQNVETLLKGQ